MSISLSFFFQTDETLRWTNAMRFNHRLRKRLKHWGLGAQVGTAPICARVTKWPPGVDRVSSRDP